MLSNESYKYYKREGLKFIDKKDPLFILILTYKMHTYTLWWYFTWYTSHQGVPHGVDSLDAYVERYEMWWLSSLLSWISFVWSILDCKQMVRSLDYASDVV